MEESSGTKSSDTEPDLHSPSMNGARPKPPKLDPQRRTVSFPSRRSNPPLTHAPYSEYVPHDVTEDVPSPQLHSPAEARCSDETQPSQEAGPASILKKTDPRVTIRQHYYPEGGWGWVVCVCAFCAQVLSTGFLLSYGVLYVEMLRHFERDRSIEAVWLGSVSVASGLFLSPLVVALCRQKSTRLTAVFGGLVSALGCLFTSFASQFHQVFLSYAVVLGVGLGVVKEASNLMTGQYFKRRRELVEILVLCGIGIGIAVSSAFLRALLHSIRWRLGLHAVTGIIFITFFLGIFYRSASLYHPQRRAILHLKNQRRKVKEKAANQTERPPLFDFSTLSTRTLQIVMVSAALSSFGVYTPAFYLVYIAEEEGLSNTSIYLLQMFLGLSFALGCGGFGFLVVRSSAQCMIARQYLCQASIYGLAASTLAFIVVEGYHGYVLVVWIYGIFCGGFHYSLKMYVFEKVRARNFNRAWGFVQWSQAVPVAVGIPVTGYINAMNGPKTGLFFSTACLLAGATSLFMMNCRKKNGRNEATIAATADHLANHTHLPSADNLADGVCTCDRAATRADNIARYQRAISFATSVDMVDDERRGDYLTCISEEGLAERDLLDEWAGMDFITSCNNQEMYLMISEFENNLQENVSRTNSSPRKSDAHHHHHQEGSIQIPKRTMTVIEEVTSTL